MDVKDKKHILELCISGQIRYQEAAKILGIHPKSFLRLKRRYLEEGESALLRRKPGPKNFKPVNRTPKYIEDQVLDLARQNPQLGSEALAKLLCKLYGECLHPTTVWRILKRYGQRAEQYSYEVDFYFVDYSGQPEQISTSGTGGGVERVVTYTSSDSQY